MKYAYYPGCSLTSSSVAYDESVRAVCNAVNLELAEVDDWNCCGATEAATLNQLASHALVARNLALVEPDVSELTAPCAACYLNLKKTDKVMQEHAGLRDKLDQSLAAGELSYDPGRLRIRHLLDVLFSEVGVERFTELLKAPLHNLRVASYYGCQVVRPSCDFDDTEHPKKLDEIMTALGADVIDYPLKTHCCGGHMTQISDELSNELIRRLLDSATTYNADVIVCLCPMCQLNLDAYQGRVNQAFGTDYQIPIVFFTQLIGWAIGIDAEELGFGKEIVAARAVIEAKLAQGPPERPAKRRKHRRPGDKQLPLPE